ncbi:TerD family protein [Streptomyces solicathayae]|uniref:TerD family protein n=1 Tax=Streptomyces solicathayae TaxID=3081768 RepID=A0ABZ0LY39_9ACTN|nr:TerD family protein [Streptomyces sp. HUAS YS2]WOX24349.1 TerD family protein [Streptomyces sp. HUAS YS2]
MTQIPKGANIPVPAQALQVAVSWLTGAGVPDVDVSALLLDASGRVRGDADLVFYNHGTHPSGAVRHLGKSAPGAPGAATADWLWLDLARVEPEVERIVVAASADGGPFGRVPGLDVRVADPSGGPVAYFAIGDATTETAFVFGEFYRRTGGWKFRAVGQGYASGLAGLATDFGIVVEPPPAPIPGPGYVPPPAAPYQPPTAPYQQPAPYQPPAAPAQAPYQQPPAAPVPAPYQPPAAPAYDPFSSSFRPSTHQGRGKETVHCDPAIPPGWALLEIEAYNSISTTIESCDAYGRAEDFLLMAYEDDVHARTVALVPRDRPLALRVEADTPWTLRVLPLTHARRFDGHIEGHAHDLVIYEGPAGVLDFFHGGESNFTVHLHTPPEYPEYDEEDQDLLVNEIGDTRVSAPVPGPGLLRISGDGPWKCAVRR